MWQHACPSILGTETQNPRPRSESKGTLWDIVHSPVRK
jgi:hypothetical protein